METQRWENVENVEGKTLLRQCWGVVAQFKGTVQADSVWAQRGAAAAAGG